MGNLWQQQAAILASYYYIKQVRFAETLALAEEMLDHPHDLIHKAVGWMLREAGTRNFKCELVFLKNTVEKMPRTMLCYSIEKIERGMRGRILRGDLWFWMR